MAMKSSFRFQRTEPHLALKIFKPYNAYKRAKEEYVFVVVDLALGEQYPENFFCVLPRSIDTVHISRNNLVKQFGREKAKRIAIRLLKDAKRRFFDSEDILKEIDVRLRELEPKKPKPCLNCGVELEHHRRRFCKPCADQRTKEYLAEYHRRRNT